MFGLWGCTCGRLGADGLPDDFGYDGVADFRLGPGGFGLEPAVVKSSILGRFCSSTDPSRVNVVPTAVLGVPPENDKKCTSGIVTLKYQN